MPTINEITREKWILDCFPEWGKWLIEDIDETVVRPGTFAAWWMGCTGIWIKSEGGCNISIDMFSGNAKISHYKWANNHKGMNFQLGRMAGSNQIHQNPRNIPHVIDPFQVENIDAFIVTHDHADHMDIYSTTAMMKHDIPFIGPKFSTDKWLGWGVPGKRLITVKPGDVVKVKDIEIHVLEAFDRTALITAPPEGSIVGRFPNDMDDRAVNYLIKTPGGTFYHSGDSHFSNYTVKHGKQFAIDVAIASFGENPPGISDKVTASDVIRMAENLRCKVMIPVHYDIWPTFTADPAEIAMIYNFKKDRLQYQFKVFIWQVGGKFIFPDDKDKGRYTYPRGFTDAFEVEPNIPFKSFL
jgi:L-ascorbate 6-phosphate lactonase